MKKSTIITTSILALIIIGAFVFFGRDDSQKGIGSTKNNEPFVVPELGERYINQKYNFSFAVPEGFSVREFSDELSGSNYVIVENEKAEGIQIVVSPFDDIKVLNVATIKNEIPDMKMSDTEVLEIGENHTGVAFLSDSPAFGGASREVWFVFKANLYQISTYERLDDLLKEVFATWQFSAN